MFEPGPKMTTMAARRVGIVAKPNLHQATPHLVEIGVIPDVVDRARKATVAIEQ